MRGIALGYKIFIKAAHGFVYRGNYIAGASQAVIKLLNCACRYLVEGQMVYITRRN